jgi:hypothetical protein
MTSMKKFLRRDIVKLIYSVLRRKLKRQIVAFLWPVVSLFLSRLSESKARITPVDYEPQQVFILVGTLDASASERIPGIDLTLSLREWVHTNMSSSDIEMLTSLEYLPLNNSKGVIVVSYDWLITVNLWKRFFSEIRRIATQARRLEVPIWVVLPDAFDLNFAIPASILVASCGGSIILQTNTATEGEEFGLVFPSGPHIWTLPPRVLSSFSSETLWENREPNILLAISSDPRRKTLMEVIAKSLSESQWIMKYSNLELSWSDYVSLVKSCRIVMTTCWMYEIHIVGSQSTKGRIPSTAVTHRVWEGFASGCTVFTNSNKVFEVLGFKPGVHYVEIWDEHVPVENIELPSEHDLKKIAKAGQVLLSQIVNNEFKT